MPNPQVLFVLFNQVLIQNSKFSLGESHSLGSVKAGSSLLFLPNNRNCKKSSVLPPRSSAKLIKGWGRSSPMIQAIARSNDILWAYMMNCTYSGHRQDSHTHVMTLLDDLKTRYWFIMRMAVTYCVKDVMSIYALSTNESRTQELRKRQVFTPGSASATLD